MKKKYVKANLISQKLNSKYIYLGCLKANPSVPACTEFEENWKNT